MKINTDSKKIDEILNRGTIVETLPGNDEFRKKLLSGKQLRFYIGFDATAPTLHLSHAKNFMLLEKFRQLGHEVIVLFGDFTARIGDPSDQGAARKQLTKQDVDKNVKVWKKLIKPLMGFDDKKNPPKIKYNSEWLAKLTMEEVLDLASNFTVQQIVERDMFQKRLKEGKPIHLHEFLYPLMQGYDSVAMDVDVEVCGTDQIFNALAGRTLQKKLNNKEKFVVAVTLMENPKTGELMSKSNGTGVFLNVSSNDMFGQIMSQSDEMIELLFVNCTYLTLDEIKKLNIADSPRDTKIRLGEEVVKIFFGEKMASEAKENFINTFAKKETPEEIKEYEIADKALFEAIASAGIVKSKSEARRNIEQGGVKVNEKVVEDIDYRVKSGDVIQKGKRFFIKAI